MQKRTKIAITGASGFLGKNLINLIDKKHYQITVIDRDNSIYPKGIKVVKGNLLSGEGIDEFLSDSEILIHLAGQVLPGKISMNEGNYNITKNLVEHASKHNIRKIIFSSTIAVYGSSKDKEFNENDTCMPNTEYGKSKYEAEIAIKEWAKKNKKKYLIFRFFSLYGLDNKKGFIYNLCKDYITKGIITVYGDGMQKRDIVWGEDAANLLLTVLKKDLEGTYNVGSGENYSVLEIISLLNKISGKRCQIIFKQKEKEKVDNIFYSIKKLSLATKWKSKVKAEVGIKTIYKFIGKNTPLI